MVYCLLVFGSLDAALYRQQQQQRHQKTFWYQQLSPEEAHPMQGRSSYQFDEYFIYCVTFRILGGSTRKS